MIDSGILYRRVVLTALLFLVPSFTICPAAGADTFSQKSQLALVTVKALARLIANAQSCDLEGRKLALLANVVATLTNAADTMIGGRRGIASKLSHGNSAVWNLLKCGEEFNFLRTIQKKIENDDDYGDSLVDDDSTEDILSEHYHGYEKPENVEQLSSYDDDDFWSDSFDGPVVDSNKELRRFLQLVLVAVEWGASAYSTFLSQEDKENHIYAQIVRAISGLLLQYLFKDGKYKSNSEIGKIEMITSGIPHVWDVGKGAWDLYQIEQERLRKIKEKEEEEELRRREEEERRRQREEDRRQRVGNWNNEPEPHTCGICRLLLMRGERIAFVDCQNCEVGGSTGYHEACIDRYIQEGGAYGFRDRFRTTGSCPTCRNRDRSVINRRVYQPGPNVIFPEDGPEEPEPPRQPNRFVCSQCNNECQRVAFTINGCNHACCQGCRVEVLGAGICPNEGCNRQVGPEAFRPNMIQRAPEPELPEIQPVDLHEDDNMVAD